MTRLVAHIFYEAAKWTFP